MKLLQKLTRISTTAIALLALFSFLLPGKIAFATGLTNSKDTLTNSTASAASNHTILFTTTTTIAEGETIDITFPATWNLTSIVEDDVDIQDDGVDLTTAADCSGTEKASVVVSSQILRFTICAADGGAIAGGSTVTIKVGTNATQSGTGANRVTNGSSVGSNLFTIGGTMTDSGSFAVSLLTDDSVNVTANVDPSITFTLDDTTIGFGTLDVSNDRWATGNLAGTTTAQTPAHGGTIATNATSGWAITYNGATLTDATTLATIDVADINGDPDGTPGSEQFAIGISTDGNSTPATDYDEASNNYRFIASTTTSMISENGPTNTENLSFYYLANIAGTTEPGTYTTNVTYIATGTF